MRITRFPQGYIGLDFGKNGLRSLSYYLVPSKGQSQAGARQKTFVKSVMHQLRKYFYHERINLKVKIDWSDIPKFTKKVLKVTRTIPYGEVTSYGAIASKIGKPKATRAVGQALARNPLPIVIPCHRVIKSDGSLGGFTWGRKWKQRLLEHEGFKIVKGKLAL